MKHFNDWLWFKIYMYRLKPRQILQDLFIEETCEILTLQTKITHEKFWMNHWKSFKTSSVAYKITQKLHALSTKFPWTCTMLSLRYFSPNFAWRHVMLISLKHIMQVILFFWEIASWRCPRFFWSGNLQKSSMELSPVDRTNTLCPHQLHFLWLT